MDSMGLYVVGADRVWPTISLVFMALRAHQDLLAQSLENPSIA